MKTLTVALADLEGTPHGTASSRTNVTVTARYTGVVALTSGKIIPPAIKRARMTTMGVFEFDVYESDSTLVKAEYRGFAIRVDATIRQTGGGPPRETHVTRTVKVLSSASSPISLGTLSPAEPLPPQWATVDEFAADIDAAASAAQTAAAAADASRDLAESAVLSGGALPVRYANLLTDPTYQVFGTAGWSYLGGTAVRSGDNAVFTGNGTLGGIGLYSSAGQAFTGKAGHRYYVRAEMEIPAGSANNAASLSVSLSDNSTHRYVGGSQAAVASPVKGTKYTISGVIELPADWDGKGIRLYQRAYFASAAAANGSQVLLYPATVFDLTEASPELPEPTKEVLDREVGALAAESPVTELRRRPTAVLGRTFATKTKRSVAAGPHVVFRFDDGYANNLEIAAPILARYGYVGTLVACSHPTEWLGTVRNGYDLMTGAQLKRLHEVYGWEIGAHMPKHEDAIATPLGTWVSALMDNIDQLKSHGLPRPTTFAYPNGSRTPSTDRYVYAMFDQCGLTGGPERIPWPYDKGTFYSGWCAVGGISEATADIAVEKCKKYIASSMNEGRVAVVGIHGITHEDPTVDFFLRADKFTALVQWVWEQGYPVSTMSDVPNHNMLADGGFMDYEVTTPAKGSYPWMLNSGGWSRQFGTGLGRVGMRIAGNLPASPIWYFEQRAKVEPGREYRVYIHHTSTVTAGSVRVRAYPMTILGDAVGGGLLLTSITATGSTWLTGTFTAPAGAHTVRINVSTDGGSGANGDFLVDAVAMFPTDTYDPLA